MAQGGGSGTIQDGAVNDGMVSIDAICDFLQFWEDVKNATSPNSILCYQIGDGGTARFYLVMDGEGRIVDTSLDPMGFPRYSLINSNVPPCPRYANQTIQYECDWGG
jgi:hypothetical protein